VFFKELPQPIIEPFHILFAISGALEPSASANVWLQGIAMTHHLPSGPIYSG
jgi:hypothetical protein